MLRPSPTVASRLVTPQKCKHALVHRYVTFLPCCVTRIALNESVRSVRRIHRKKYKPMEVYNRIMNSLEKIKLNNALLTYSYLNRLHGCRTQNEQSTKQADSKERRKKRENRRTLAKRYCLPTATRFPRSKLVAAFSNKELPNFQLLVPVS